MYVALQPCVEELPVGFPSSLSGVRYAGDTLWLWSSAGRRWEVCVYVDVDTRRGGGVLMDLLGFFLVVW